MFTETGREINRVAGVGVCNRLAQGTAAAVIGVGYGKRRVGGGQRRKHAQ